MLLARHPWKRLAWAALSGTAVYYVGWTLNGEDPTRLPVTAYFLGVFFAGFAAAPFLILRRIDIPGALFPIVFPIANALATWVGLMVLFGAPARFWSTLALALACLLLAAVGRPAGVALSRTYLGLGVFFVTVAVPLQFHGEMITSAGWVNRWRWWRWPKPAQMPRCGCWRGGGADRSLATPAGGLDCRDAASLDGGRQYAVCHQPGRGGGVCRGVGAQSWGLSFVTRLRQLDVPGWFRECRVQPHRTGGCLPGNSPLLVLRGGILSRFLRRLWPV